MGQRRDRHHLPREANGLAIAVFATAGILHFAKGLHRTEVDRKAGVFAPRAYRPWLREGKTACVVGAGGIGLEVGRLLATLGMRVVGTRRQAPVQRPLPAGFVEIGGAVDLDRFLPDSDVVAVCCRRAIAPGNATVNTRTASNRTCGSR